MRSALALGASSLVLFLLAPVEASPVMAYFGGAAMSAAYLCVLYAMYRSGEPLRMRTGEILLAAERPSAFRFWYGLISVFGWLGLFVCFAGVVRSLTHVA